MSYSSYRVLWYRINFGELVENIKFVKYIELCMVPVRIIICLEFLEV